MRITESCAACLYDKQKQISCDARYLSEIKDIIDSRGEDDTSPYLIYRFSKVQEKYFGRPASYKKIKKKYNDLVLSMEESIRKSIEDSGDPFVKALVYARIGNYIDFGAMDHVDEKAFLALFEGARLREEEIGAAESFKQQCQSAEKFLLIADNCGEIVLDKLFLEQVAKKVPGIQIGVMVRGGEALNDVTEEDAEYVGIGNLAKIISNGHPIAGTIYSMLPEYAKQAMDQADVILSKGQGNYESLSGQGRHIFYSFLCKCDLFTERFQVPKFTGIFREEGE